MSIYRGINALQFNSPTGLLTFSEDSTVIKDSLKILFSTRIGERVNLPTFGSRLPELVFDQNDAVIRSLAKTYVIDAINEWEPRISIINTAIVSDVSNHKLQIVIDYTIIKTGTNDRFIYVQDIGF